MHVRVDCVFFDGASNVQKAGDILAAQFPRIHVQTCAAHCVSLFFSDICKRLWEVRLLLINYRRLYRLFGSGAMHAPYALFIAQSRTFNAGRKVGLIKAAGTRMAGHVYAQHRMLRLKEPIIATFSSAAFKALKLKGLAKKAEEFATNPDMWEATFVLLRVLYPMLRCLRLGDTSACGGMSKIVYYVHQTDKALEKSLEMLKSLKYFEDHEPSDANAVVGMDLDDDFNDNDDDDEYDENNKKDVSDDEEEGDDDSVEELHFGEKIALFWKKRRQKLITPLSLAGWFCSPATEIRKDVIAFEEEANRLEVGANRLKIESVIAKQYYPIEDAELGRLITIFWAEWNQFQTQQGPSYGRVWIWDTPELKHGNDHLWHKLYSIPYTEVFGKVACRVCSKPLGCGNAERSWGVLKHLKSGKRSHLTGERAQKQATVYGAASLDRVRALESVEEHSGTAVETRWTDADMVFEMGLENFETLPGVVPAAVVPKRLFKAWMEDWEFDCLHKNDPLAKERLLHKYGGLRWEDKDDNQNLCIADTTDMEYQGGRGGSGWCVIGLMSDGTTEPWIINCVIDEMAEYNYPPEMNVEVITNTILREANKAQFAEEATNKNKQQLQNEVDDDENRTVKNLSFTNTRSPPREYRGPRPIWCTF